MLVLPTSRALTGNASWKYYTCADRLAANAVFASLDRPVMACFVSTGLSAAADDFLENIGGTPSFR